MATFRQSLLSAILKQLLRGKSLVLALLGFWINPSSPNTKTVPPVKVADANRNTSHHAHHAPGFQRRPQDFIREVEALVLSPLAGDGLLRLSGDLKAQFRHALQIKPECMLPSYNHQLPSGHERGRYLALDVGGSTLRVALVELRGSRGQGTRSESEIVRIKSYPIGMEVKQLEGLEFFDWMAARIVETLEKEREGHRDVADGALPMSMAWSFPIEQTSLRGGRVQGMGKGFQAALSLEGEDLGDVVEAACQRAGLEAELRVILNDGNATLMSCAYTHSSTRFGLILGTGTNIAAFLPVPLIGTTKFGNRPDAWYEQAHSVIVNTELGMFGKDILSITRWDASLKKGHPRPDFQPLEHMVSGFYLGEIARFMVLEAIETTGLLGGVVPESLLSPYSLTTETLSIIQGDASLEFEKSIETFTTRHPSSHKPTPVDMAFLRSLTSAISHRSASIVAASLHAIWELRLEGVREAMSVMEAAHASTGERTAAAEAELALERTMVAYNGSVIESYPGYKDKCQGLIDELVAATSGGKDVGMDLVPAKESSILGAGVALAAALTTEDS